MKKKMRHLSLLVVCMALFLSGCGTKEEWYTQIEDITAAEYVEMDMPDELSVEQYEIPLAAHANECGADTSDGIIYYLVDYSDYLTDQTGVHDIPFEDKYNTQVWAYDTQTGENKLLYKYQEDKCVSVGEICCNKKYLIWEEYRQGGWKVVGFPLGESSPEPKVIVERDPDRGQLWDISPTLTEDALYWYDQLEGDHPISLFKCGLEDGKIDKIRQGLAVQSFLTVMPKGETVFCENYEDGSDLIFHKLQDQEESIVRVPTKINSPVISQEICAWARGSDVGDRESVYVYHREDKALEEIDISPYTGAYYEVMDSFLFVVCRDYGHAGGGGLYCYDTNNKGYVRLPFDEEDYFFFIQRPADGTLFLEMSKEGDRDSEENLFRAIIISKKEE